ncbi:MAG: dTDP-4-dehydrorhamnose reductase [Bacteroidales bacterium]|nr:dTDP-4-dehydrorhamnose reductase [Bacteroidales bacterium]
MQTILITGSKGQLGNEIKKLSVNYADFNFLFTDIEELDITNIDALTSFFDIHKPNYLINCAAYTAVDNAEDEPEKADLINHESVDNLAKISNQFNTKFIHISTDYVFDGQNYRPYTEIDAENPKSVYGTTKLDGEEAVRQHVENHIIIRTSWLYSTFGNNFVKTMLRLGKEKEQLTVIFDQIGTPTYANDLADAILQIVSKSHKKEEAFKSGIYHYSNEGACSWYDFSTEIMNLAKLNCKIKPILGRNYPTRAARPFYSVLDKSKIKANFGIEIPHWKKSLQNCLTELL